MSSPSEPPSQSLSKPFPLFGEFAQKNGYVYRHAVIAVGWALFANLLIAGIKLFFALVTRSTALFSEGLHSLGDGLNSVILLFGIMRGSRQPDRTHAFGYGLETNFWAFCASIILIVSGLWAMVQGVDRILHPETLVNFEVALIILMVSIVVEVFAVYKASKAVLQEVGMEDVPVLQVFFKAYQQIRHVVGPTTRFVYYEDLLAFLGAFVALSAITITKFSTEHHWLPPEHLHLPDAVAAIFIGILLVILGAYLFKSNQGFLTGAAAPARVEKEIRDLVENLHEVSKIHDLKTMDQGISGLIVHMTVEVEPDVLVKDVDDLGERIKEKLHERISKRIGQVSIEFMADESDIEWGEKFNKLITEGRSHGYIKPREEEMLRNMYDFTESVLRDVMVPRIDAEYIEVETPLSEVADLMIETGHSRLPVFREDVDDMVGVVHARDVFNIIRQKKLETPLAEIMREVNIYPENKPVSDLLEDFKRKKIQMGVVADEHGGFAGLVTIEDLMEEIVGELWDEHDSEEMTLVLMSPNRMVVSGKYDMEDLNEKYGLNFPTDDFMTIGGFVFGLLGREPDLGDTVTFEDLKLTVNEVDGPRIITITIESPVSFEEKQAGEETETGDVIDVSAESESI